MSFEKAIGFYSKAGGGHKSGLDAMLEEISSVEPDLQTKGFDFTSKDNRNFGLINEQSYTDLTENWPVIWNLFCLSIRSKTAINALYQYVNCVYGSNIESIIRREQQGMQNPEAILILCTYYFVADIIAKRCPDIPSGNVQVLVTDTFGPENVWFGTGKSQYIAMSKQSKQKALNNGVSEANVRFDGPIFNSRFNQPKTLLQNQEFAKSKSLNLDLPIVEIISGGASMPGGMEIFSRLFASLEHSEFKFQIVLICGRNNDLLSKSNSLIERHPRLQKYIRIEGFSNQIYDWMNVANMVISKAGPGIMQETMALQKPIFACSYIWPQEQTNFELIESLKVGKTAKTPELLVCEIMAHLCNPQKLIEINQSLKELNYKSNINCIAKDLLLQNES